MPDHSSPPEPPPERFEVFRRQEHPSQMPQQRRAPTSPLSKQRPQAPGDSAELVRLTDTLPANATLSVLGERLERGRLATRLPTDSFLAEHDLNLRTWWRLLYGLLTAHGAAPLSATIIRYAAAVGVDQHEALELARRTFGDAMPPRSTSALGEELERRRVETGLPTRTYLHQRGLAVSTWHRLLGNSGATPTRTTIAKYAKAVGLDVETALRLADQDRRSRQAAAGPGSGSGQGSALPPPAPGA